jgi:alanine racemase
VLAENNISQCVYSLDYANQLSYYATKEAVNIKAHIKIDTGMGRIGFQHDSTSIIDDVYTSCNLNGIIPEGIFTHFAVSDCGEGGRTFTLDQHKRFSDIVRRLESKGLCFEYKHCSNSAAAVDYPEFQMNMVRAGIVLYGLMPSGDTVTVPDLKPVMSLKTVVSHVKRISRGATISYGCDFVADREMTIATVPMGYADGFWRSNVKADTSLLIRGKKAPIVGRICMDQLMLDVSEIQDVKLGDIVTVFGDSDGVNTVDALAYSNDTINYEIVCSIGKRVPRVFVKDGHFDGIHLGILDTTFD